MNTNSNQRDPRNDTPRGMDNNPANRDPITGEPGAHPVGTGAGAVVGGVVGGVVGSAAGPVGTVAGAAIGGALGGLGGKAAGEAANPTIEDAYWRENYKNRPYAKDFGSYDDLAPAYRYGWESATVNRGQSFEDAEPTLRNNWDKVRGKSNTTWDKAKEAVKDAWSRVTPGKDRNDHDRNSPGRRAGE